jgi:hypothetical protein
MDGGVLGFCTEVSYYKSVVTAGYKRPIITPIYKKQRKKRERGNKKPSFGQLHKTKELPFISSAITKKRLKKDNNLTGLSLQRPLGSGCKHYFQQQRLLREHSKQRDGAGIQSAEPGGQPGAQCPQGRANGSEELERVPSKGESWSDW